MRKPNIPKDLGPNGASFWKKCNAEFIFTKSHDIERLIIACRCLDDIAIAEQTVRDGGHFVTNRYGNVCENPAVKTILNMRKLFIQTIRELGLDLSKIDAPRPPKRY